MGVYIEGMEMPKKGSWVTLRVFPDGQCFLYSWCGNDFDFMEHLTAVPLPPHGRLIDADALEQDAQGRLLECDKYDNQFNKPFEIMRAIRLAPVVIAADMEDMEWKMKNCCCCDDKTIIPAEEGET